MWATAWTHATFCLLCIKKTLMLQGDCSTRAWNSHDFTARPNNFITHACLRIFSTSASGSRYDETLLHRIWAGCAREEKEMCIYWLLFLLTLRKAVEFPARALSLSPAPRESSISRYSSKSVEMLQFLHFPCTIISISAFMTWKQTKIECMCGFKPPCQQSLGGRRL